MVFRKKKHIKIVRIRTAIPEQIIWLFWDLPLESQPYTSNMLGKMSTKSEDKPTEHVK